MNIRIRTFYGPNIHAPFAGIMAEFTNPFVFQLPVSAIETQWHLIDEEPIFGSNPPSTNISLVNLVAALAVNLQHPEDLANANVVVAAEDPTNSIFLGFVDREATIFALRTAVELAIGIFTKASGKNVSLEDLAIKLKQARSIIRMHQPQAPIVRTLVQLSRMKGIPIYPVAEASRIWLFGQGAAGVHFFEAASERDTYTGMRLSGDKTWSNKLVKRMGFPGVTHDVARHKAQATKIANQLGYPVVVKPISSGKGRGVSACVVDDDELGIAFACAAAISPKGVIVERHVAGNDYRLALFGGKLVWVAARYPASVVADGHMTINELIDAENHRRKGDASAAELGLVPIHPDQDMLLHLKKQGLSLTSKPPAGVTVNLRSIANVSKGGTIADLTDQLHPDNREMAEAIASGFRMDAMGIDFITPDISRSWRDVPCAVIEVNGAQGIYFDSRAQRVLEARFPAGSNGRIPSVLLINPPPGLLTKISDAMSSKGRVVGQTDAKTTQLAGYSRCEEKAGLSRRVAALISDPRCDAIAIETTVEKILERGIPLDKFDLALSFEPLPGSLQQVMQSCCHKLVNNMQLNELNEILEVLLDEVLSRYA